MHVPVLIGLCPPVAVEAGSDVGWRGPAEGVASLVRLDQTHHWNTQVTERWFGPRQPPYPPKSSLTLIHTVPFGTDRRLRTTPRKQGLNGGSWESTWGVFPEGMEVLTVFLALEQPVDQAGEPGAVFLGPPGCLPQLPVQPGLIRARHRRGRTLVPRLDRKSVV